MKRQSTAFLNGFRDLFRYKQILLIDCFFYIFLVGFLLILATTALTLIDLPWGMFIKEQPTKQEMLYAQTQIGANIIQIVQFVILAFLVIFFASAYAHAMKWGIAADIVAGKKIKKKDFFNAGRTFTLKMIKIQLTSVLLFIVPLIIAAVPFALFYSWNKIAAFIIGIFVCLFFYFWIYAALFYKYAMMVLKPKASTKEILLASWNHLKQEPKKVWGTLIFLGIFLFIFRVVVNFVAQVLPFTLGVLLWLGTLIILATWIPFFLLHTLQYKSKKR